MEKTYKTIGIVLTKKDWQEADRLFSIYTKDYGKLKLRAVGIRKIKSKLAGHLSSYGLVDLMIAKSKNQDKIAAARLIEIFNINFDQDFIYLNLFFELLDKGLREGEKDEQIWDLLNKAISWLIAVKGYNEKNLVAIFFALKLMQQLGYAPELKNCIVCRQPAANTVFSLAENSVVCADCRLSGYDKRIKVTEELIEFLDLIFNQNNLKQINISKKNLTEIIGFLKQWVPYVLEIEIMSLKQL